ncbi:MAG: hypothetical protein ABI555_04590 [Chloroflexota bacterium]
MTQRTTRRIVISGNGAAWYAGFSIWLAALESRPLKADLVCVPAGLLARGRFAWRPGDVLFAISSSGEFRDLAEAVSDAGSPPVVAVTASPGSTVARAAVAKAVVGLEGETAFTHSTAYVGNVALGLAIVARATGDDSLAAAVADLPDSSAAAIRVAEEWPIADALGSWRPRTVLGVGDGPAWAAGLEMALLAREVARIPGEGAELREGATSSMFGLSPDDLALLAEVGAPDSETAQLETETVRMLEERGTRVLRLPGGRLGDRRLAAILAFPASVRAAIHLAESAGLDPDAPTTTPTYYLTARRPSEASASSKL